MGAFKGLSEFFPDIVEEAKKQKCSEANILILQGDKEGVKEKYPKTYEAILSCTHNSDQRDPFEYAQDLVANWLFEDWLVNGLRKNRTTVLLNGADRKREILPNEKVGGHSDTIVVIGGQRRGMEITANFTGYWKREMKVDLRDNKYNNLVYHKCLLCGIDMKSKEFFILDMSSKSVEATYEEEHAAWGNKPCYSVILKESDFMPFDFMAVTKRLNEIGKETGR